MSKKLLLLCFTSFSALTGFSQIVVEAIDFPQWGDSIYQGIDTLIPLSITPGSAGADQTWDFSQLRTRQGSTLHFSDPSLVAGGDSFPSAFLAVEQFGGWGFADSANGTIEIIGFTGDFTGLGADMAVHFQDPQTIFTFPSTYLSSYMDTAIIDVKMEAPPELVAQSPIPIDSIRFKRYTEIQSEIDGWGTVTTPLVSYAALRQFNIEHSIDSIWIYADLLGGWGLLPGQLVGFDNPRVTDLHRYNYIIKEIGYYAVSLTTNLNDSVERATFLSDPTLCCFGAGVEETNIAEEFSIYPNPANDEFVISMNKTEKLYYAVFDITGKQVLAGNLNSNLTKVNTAVLADGLYICKVFSADGKHTGSQKISILGN